MRVIELQCEESVSYAPSATGWLVFDEACRTLIGASEDATGVIDRITYGSE